MTVDCLHYAVEIERRVPPQQWPRALERVPPACKAECETYLRGIAARIRAKRAITSTGKARTP